MTAVGMGFLIGALVGRCMAVGRLGALGELAGGGDTPRSLQHEQVGCLPLPLVLVFLVAELVESAVEERSVVRGRYARSKAEVAEARAGASLLVGIPGVRAREQRPRGSRCVSMGPARARRGPIVWSFGGVLIGLAKIGQAGLGLREEARGIYRAASADTGRRGRPGAHSENMVTAWPSAAWVSQDRRRWRVFGFATGAKGMDGGPRVGTQPLIRAASASGASRAQELAVDRWTGVQDAEKRDAAEWGVKREAFAGREVGNEAEERCGSSPASRPIVRQNHGANGPYSWRRKHGASGPRRGATGETAQGSRRSRGAAGYPHSVAYGGQYSVLLTGNMHKCGSPALPDMANQGGSYIFIFTYVRMEYGVRAAC